MIQSGCGEGFLLEATEPLGIRRGRRVQHLDRHVALQPRIARPIHLAHSASAERAEDFVRAEMNARRKRQCAIHQSRASIITLRFP